MKPQPINKLLRAALLTAAVAVLATASTSCSKEEAQTPNAGTAVIRIGSSAIGAVGSESDAAAQTAQTAQAAHPATRAMVTATDALPNIYFFRKDASTSTLPTDMYTGGSTATGNRAGDAAGAIAWTSTPAPLYARNQDYAFFVGCWPGPGSGSSTTVADGVVTWTIDGKTDIMTTDRFSAGNYTSPSTANLTFQHRLAALEVIVKADAGVSQEVVEALWGKITSIERTSAPSNAIYTATNAGVNNGLTFSYSKTIPLLKGTTYNDAFTPIAVPANESTEVVASAMLAPTSGSGTIITLRINTSNGAPVSISVVFKNGTSYESFTAGMKHTVTLLLGAPERKVVVGGTQVTPWGTGGESGGSVTPPATAKAPNKGYLDWNNNALLKTGSFNGKTYTIPLFTLDSYGSYTTASNGEKFLSLSPAIEGELPYITLEVAKTEETGTGAGWETSTVKTEGKGNASGTGGTYVNVNVIRANWATAYAACKAKGADWRLPRLSELMQMSMNKTEMNKTTGFTAISNLFYYYWRPPYTDSYGRPQPGYWTTSIHSAHNTYWAATEGYGTTAWAVNVNGNSAGTNPQTSYFRVRCVKEVL